jgi:hypothetical protein
MKKSDVALGQVYAVKVSGRLQPVQVVATCPHGGWRGRNLQTGRVVRIRSAARLRYLIPPAEQRFQRDLTERGAPS